jgi:type II secretory pathway pseudopilin PulG
MLKKIGYTLLELVIVTAIVGVVVTLFFSSMTTARSSFQNSGFQIERQQEARKALDRISSELKMSSPSWQIGSSYYNISTNINGDQLDFYLPVFGVDNEIIMLKAVRYYLGGLNNAQLLRKEGASSIVIANNIENKDAQKPFFAFNNTDHTVVDIKIPIIKNNSTFTLRSQLNLRNRQVPLEEEVLVAGISE